jgi:DNA-binding transcriptional ArsR family regulator
MRYPATDLDSAGVLKALAHPARLAIVQAIGAAGGCCCGDIVRRLPLAQSTVSQHLKILKESGLIQGVIDGPRANYAIDRENALAAAKMLRGLAAQIEAGAAGCCGMVDEAADEASDVAAGEREVA